MSSRSREDNDAAILGKGSRRSGGGKDIEEADMEEFMNDILSPGKVSSSSSPRATPLPSDEGVEGGARRPSVRDRQERRSSSLLRNNISVSRGGGDSATEVMAEEEYSGTVVGKARRKRSSGSIIDR